MRMNLNPSSSKNGCGCGQLCAGAVAGRDARSPQGAGTFKDATAYNYLDIVAHNGGSFIARRDGPGSCPGEGWQLLASQGKRGDKGEQGERGPKGEQGPSGPIIATWEIDRVNYRARDHERQLRRWHARPARSVRAIPQ
jgi:hypothetical protein